MREIKFRAWDRQQLRMAALNAWHFDTRLIDASANGEVRGFRNDDRYEVMQFTGFKDKNGKEIYEGDILGEGEERYVVEFVNGSFGIQTRHYGWSPVHM